MSLVIPLGFEPKTYRLEICCSIQLSYGTRGFRCAKMQKSAKIVNGKMIYITLVIRSLPLS